jgi:hypothetical protein
MHAIDTIEYNLAKTVELTRLQVPDSYSLHGIVETLNRARIRFLLVGVLGLAGWVRDPRACQYVDLLISPRRLGAAIDRIQRLFGEMNIVESEGFVEMVQATTGVLPAIRIHVSGHPLHEMVMRNSVATELPAHEVVIRKRIVSAVPRVRIRVPNLELAIARTFESMTRRPWSDAEKYQDAHDFLCMIKGNSELDMDRLRDLAEAHAKGLGSKIVRKVNGVRAGKRFEI